MTVTVFACLNVFLFCINKLVGHRIIKGNYCFDMFEVSINILVYRLVDEVSDSYFVLISQILFLPLGEH